MANIWENLKIKKTVIEMLKITVLEGIVVYAIS